MFTLIVSNKPSPLNKKLIKFFQLNLLSLNKASIVFDFEVAHPNEADSYLKRGISQYPVLMRDDLSIVGVEKIIQHLKTLVVKHNTKIVNKTDGDRVDDFWKQTIGKFEMDEHGKIKPEKEDEDSLSDNLQHKIQAVFEKRSEITKPGKLKPSSTGKPNSTSGSTGMSGMSGSSSNKSRNVKTSESKKDESPAQTIANMKREGKTNIDDDLMRRFFENQEESV